MKMQTVAQPALPSSLPGEKLGRYQPLVEVCKDPLGGLWLSRIGTGKDEGKRVFVRRVAPTDSIDATVVRETCEYAFVVMEVKHEFILALSDVVIDKGHLGAACEFLEADTLKALMQAGRDRKIAVPMPVALRIASDVLQAFSAVHAFATEQEDDPPPVHGGFNPYRVLVSPKGQVLLADIELLSPKLFAAARKLDATIAGFATPEHTNETAVLDARTDVYQVGAMLWEMLSGNQLPSTVPAPRLEGVPESIADLVARAMAVHQDARFPTATAMADALHNAPGTSIASSAELGKFISEVLAEQFEIQRKTIAATEDPKPVAAPAGAAAGGALRPGAKPMPSTARAAAPPRPSGGSADAAKGLTPRPGGFAARLADRAARKDSVSPQPAPVSAKAPELKPGAPAAVEAAAAPAEKAAEKPAEEKPAAAPADMLPESKPAESTEAETVKHPSMAPAPGMEIAAKKTDSDRVDEIPPPARGQVKTLELDDGELVEEGSAGKRAVPPPAPGAAKPMDSGAAEPVAGPARAALATEDLDALTPPKSRKTMFAIVGGVVGLALLIVIIAVASGGSRKPDPSVTRQGTPTDTTTATAQPSATATETAAATASAAPAETAAASASAAPTETAAAATATATAAVTATAATPAKPYVPPPTGPAPGTKKPKFVPKGI